MAIASGMRIGDADREATAASLREHFALGRLTLDEFNERLNATFAAKTDLDLNRITSDLPYVPGYGTGWTQGPTSARPLAAGQDPWRQGYGHQGYQQQGYRQQGGPRTSGLAGLFLVVLAIAMIAPFALAGLWVARPVLIVLTIFTVGRRILRWLLGGRSGGRRGRRWPI